MPEPPISFDQQMVLYREMAQQRVSTPDFGITQTLDDSSRRTATEISAIGNLFSQSADLRMRVFRMQLSELYRQCWAILSEHKKDSLDFFYNDTLETLPEEAMHEEYEILPSGSADGVNKQFHYQKALGRFQMFANDPFVDQGELRRSVLEADDPGLVKRLLIDPNQKKNEEAEHQAMEITVMREGFPASVVKSDDHETHVRTILDFLALKLSQGEDVSPMAKQRLLDHINQHLAMLQEDDGKAARQLANEVKELSDGVNQATENVLAAQGAFASNTPGGGMDQAGRGSAPGLPVEPAGATS